MRVCLLCTVAQGYTSEPTERKLTSEKTQTFKHGRRNTTANGDGSDLSDQILYFLYILLSFAKKTKSFEWVDDYIDSDHVLFFFFSPSLTELLTPWPAVIESWTFPFRFLFLLFYLIFLRFQSGGLFETKTQYISTFLRVCVYVCVCPCVCACVCESTH